MYSTDGSGHKNGILIEKKIVNFLNEKENKERLLNLIKDKKDIKINYQTDNVDSWEIIHKGGTQTISDMELVWYPDYNNKNNSETVLRFSIKSKKRNKKGNVGTFDLCNKSITSFNFNNKILKTEIENFQNYFKEVKHNNIEKLKENKAKYKKQVDVSVKEMLKSLTEEDIKNILSSLKNDLEIDYTLVFFYSYDAVLEKLNISWEHISILETGWETKEFEKLDYTKIMNEIRKTDKKSIKLLDRNENNKYSIRLRIALNNGLSALIGLNKDTKLNKNSKLTIKIQVDKVDYIVNTYRKQL